LFARFIHQYEPLKQTGNKRRIIFPEVFKLLNSISRALKDTESLRVPFDVDLKNFQEAHQSAGAYLIFPAHHGILSIREKAWQITPRLPRRIPRVISASSKISCDGLSLYRTLKSRQNLTAGGPLNGEV
jgi:hypothetical protein